MRFFEEIEPAIIRAAGKLALAIDGEDWAAEFGAFLSRGSPFVVILDAGDRPEPPAGKPMAIWMKAHRSELGRLVRMAIYIVRDPAERLAMAQGLSARARTSPYPMSIAVDERAALDAARALVAR